MARNYRTIVPNRSKNVLLFCWFFVVCEIISCDPNNAIETFLKTIDEIILYAFSSTHTHCIGWCTRGRTALKNHIRPTNNSLTIRLSNTCPRPVRLLPRQTIPMISTPRIRRYRQSEFHFITTNSTTCARTNVCFRFFIISKILTTNRRPLIRSPKQFFV